jgi:uncharacterized iron-regulated membrane protein
VACLGVLTSVVTGFLMWWRRRPKGGTGLPGPTTEVTRAATPRSAVIAITATAVVLGVLYPSFGVSLLVVAALEPALTAWRVSRGDDGEAGMVGDDVPVGALK